jgi:predicted phosphodiesterase
MKRILLLSDLHVGSAYGMWPAGMVEEDDQHNMITDLPQNPINLAIGAHWDNKMLPVIRKRPPDVVLWNGDVIEGPQDSEGGRGLITRSVDLQCDGTIKIIQTVRDAAPEAVFYFTAGTKYHQKGNGESADKSIAKHFKSDFGNELVVEECGIRMFCRHMISSSSSTWQYEATAPARDHLLLYLNKSEDKYGPIDIAVFSHRHRMVGVQYSSGYALITPGWQSKTPYASRVKGLASVPEIGWVMLEIYGPRKILPDTRGIATVVRPCKIVGRDGRK